MMKFTLVSNLQLAVAVPLIGFVAGGVFCLFYLYMDFRLLPEVHVDGAGACVKVVNFENSHAFNCNDVNVILRRYRTVAST